MSNNYVGLNLGDGAEGEDAGRCPAVYPPTGRQCEQPVGHEGDHSAEGAACPDCGGPVVNFTVETQDAETSARVYAAYFATLSIPLDLLMALSQGVLHLHVAEGDGSECND